MGVTYPYAKIPEMTSEILIEKKLKNPKVSPKKMLHAERVQYIRDSISNLQKFTLRLEAFYEFLYNKYRDIINITKPDAGFLSEDCYTPSEENECFPIIEDSYYGIITILNQLYQTRPKKTQYSNLINEINIIMSEASFPVTIDNNQQGFVVNIPYEKVLYNTFSAKKILRKIEEKTILTNEDLIYYEKYTDTKITINPDFHHHVQSREKYTAIRQRFIKIKDKFYELPLCEVDSDIPYALIDKLLYENNRYNWNTDPCITLRRILDKFYPGSIRKSRDFFEEKLTAAEIKHRTYFGDYLSDDSDDEEESTFNKLSRREKNKQLTEAKKICVFFNPATFQKKMSKLGEPPKPDIKNRPVIHHPTNLNRRQVNQDLKEINDRIKKGETITPQYLSSLTTQFAIAEYRGIHYVTSGWDADARRSHRKQNEIGHPQFSSAVFAATGVNSYRDMMNKLAHDPDISDRLVTNGIKIEKQLLQMQKTVPVTYNNYTYLSAFHLMQYWYSSSYDQFESQVSTRINANNNLFAPYLLNEKRPFLSTGDTPYHPLLYAYGLKLYEGHKHERLRPRWQRSGRAERPYSGKIYVSLHPITDYLEHKPSHVTSLFSHGYLPLTNLIAPERETSFLGYMPPDRVVYHYKAKYPSFEGTYKTIYEYKYGINQKMYETVQHGFWQFAPHSMERRQLIRILGEYLCAYHEVRLIEKAREIAEKNQQILIYRDANGLFSLYHPETPTTASSSIKNLVKAKRTLYRALASNQSKVVKPLDEKTFNTRLEEHCTTLMPAEAALIHANTELFHFFRNKKLANPLKVETIAPPPVKKARMVNL